MFKCNKTDLYLSALDLSKFFTISHSVMCNKQHAHRGSNIVEPVTYKSASAE